MRSIMRETILWGIMLSLTLINTANASIPVYTQSQTTISVSAAQPTFKIKLISNPTTGYSWSLTDYDENLITLVKQQYIPANGNQMGAPGTEIWTFKANPALLSQQQSTTISLTYARPWEKYKKVAPLVFTIKS